MEPLSSLGMDIASLVASGASDIVVNLESYQNTGQIEIVTLPKGLNQIYFENSVFTGVANFRIVLSPEIQNLTINLNNVNINSGSNITLDLRDGNNIIVNFSGNNILTSTGSMGIFVSSSQTVNIIGVNTTSSLTVNGGTNNSAIGNSYVPGLNTGGHIIFSGEGTVNANGGDGGITSKYSEGIPHDGGFAVGFAQNTIGSSSVVIKCNIIVNANGGKGQEIDVTSLTSIAAGNGGAGISLGDNGTLLVENCPSVSGSRINIVGGDGGEVYETIPQTGALTSLRTGGNGGDGIQIVNGIVSIQGSADIIGGNGTSLSSGQLSFPVAAGDGGSAVQFSGTSTEADNIILSGNVTLQAGNGGDSGVFVNLDGSIESLIGGNGGNVIELNNTPANIELSSITSTSGDGGTGGSPDALIDELDYLYPGDLDGVAGAESPGTGGSNGSHVKNTALTSIEVSKDTALVDGKVGSGGKGIHETIGSQGIKSKQFDILVQNMSHFGYINISRSIDLSGDNLIVQNEENINNKTIINIKQTEHTPQLISINPLYISQTFNNCLVVENLCFNAYYVSGSNVILADSIMTLISNTSIIVYKKEKVPIMVQI